MNQVKAKDSIQPQAYLGLPYSEERECRIQRKEEANYLFNAGRQVEQSTCQLLEEKLRPRPIWLNLLDFLLELEQRTYTVYEGNTFCFRNSSSEGAAGANSLQDDVSNSPLKQKSENGVIQTLEEGALRISKSKTRSYIPFTRT